MKSRSLLSITLLISTIFLLVINGCLIAENSRYKQENRALLLENDSIQAVNLLLHKERDSNNTNNLKDPTTALFNK